MEKNHIVLMQLPKSRNGREATETPQLAASEDPGFSLGRQRSTDFPLLPTLSAAGGGGKGGLNVSCPQAEAWG